MKTIAFIAAGAALATVGFVSAPQSAEAQSRGAPRGSYTQSCSDAYVNQGRLYADCRDTRGNTRASSIDLSACAASDIGNDNGLLVCYNVRGQYEGRGNGGGNNGGGWGGNNGGNNGGGWGNGGNGGGDNGGGWGGNNGGGRSSVTIYQDANYRGYSQTFRGAQSNFGSTGFNDAISSLQLQGAWEVCTDANYRGQCQIIDGNVRNLDRWGLNDRISSMRPAGRGGGW